MSADTISPSAPAARPPVVLLVEDEEMVSEVVCAMLKFGGFRTVHAWRPLEALELLRKPDFEVDVLLTDYRMPQMTGIELIQQCFALRPQLRSILYSGNVDEAAADTTVVKPTRFLRKPFTPQELTTVVRTVLAG
jgi:CheY-like chemotaxis protein